jgi:HEAT repeat protein
MTDHGSFSGPRRRSAVERSGKGARVARPESLAEIRRLLEEDPFIVADWYRQPSDDDVCEALVRALEDPAPPARRAAARALIGLNDLYASTAIYGVLRNGSPEARLAAISVLGAIGSGDPLAISQMAQAAQDPDPVVATLAQCTLVRIAG